MEETEAIIIFGVIGVVSSLISHQVVLSYFEGAIHNYDKVFSILSDLFSGTYAMILMLLIIIIVALVKIPRQ